MNSRSRQCAKATPVPSGSPATYLASFSRAVSKVKPVSASEASMSTRSPRVIGPMATAR